MTDDKAVFPPEQRKKADALRRAFEEYLSELKVLRSERDRIITTFMERIEQGKIEDVRKMLEDIE